MPTAARRESRTYSSTDNNSDNRLSDTDKQWEGGSARQASWFNQKLKSAECDFEFHQLCTSSTVTLKKNGTIAVLSPEHAWEHAQEESPQNQPLLYSRLAAYGRPCYAPSFCL